MSDFVSFPLFRFILVMRQRNVHVESHWNTLKILNKKKKKKMSKI